MHRALGSQRKPLQLFSWASGVSRTQLDQDVKKRATPVVVCKTCAEV